MNSGLLLSEKNRLFAELNGKYGCNSNYVLWKYTIPIQEFLSIVNFGDKDIPCGTINENHTEHRRLNDQIKEVSNFLTEITKGDQE